MRKFTYNGDYPNSTEDVFVCYQGEPYVGYFMPKYNEDIQQGGEFYLRYGGDDMGVSDEDIDYWIQP